MNNNIHIGGRLLHYCKVIKPPLGSKRLQYLVAMKIFLFLLALNLNLSAAVFSQQINLTVKDAPLRQVLQTIRKQTGYDFFLRSVNLKEARPVTITINATSVEDVLDRIFADQSLIYKIENRIIIIQPKADQKKADGPVSERPVIKPLLIKGRVTDNEKRPLVGVNVRVKGLSYGTTTGEGGAFEISANPDAVLQFSYIGYLTSEVAVNGKAEINVVLSEAQSQLQEMVIKGYYSTTKALNTGNVSTLRSDEISKQPVGDPLAALENRIPGLFIQQSSGATGRAYTVRLRGQNSIANGNDPLYVVDGVPFNSKPLNTTQVLSGAGGNTNPLNDLNPNDIERIEVLKDADATAIYGSRGANGVILITTKSGKPGKTDINVNVYSGASKITRKLDLMNTQEYMDMRMRAFDYDKVSPGVRDYDVNGTFDKNRYTDWQKELIGGTANVTDAQVSLSGGNQLTQFRLGGGYRYEGTVFPGDFNSNKGSGSLSLHHSSENQKFKVNFSTNYVNYVNKLPSTDLTQYILLAPNSPEPFINGNLNWANGTWKNPYSAVRQVDTQTSRNFINNLLVSYEVLNGLQIRSSFGYNREELDQSIIIPYSVLDPNIYTDPPSSRENTRSNSNISTWIIEPQLSYTKRIRKGTFDALVGMTFQETRRNSLTEDATGFSSDALIGNFAAATTVMVYENTNSQYRYDAIYSRIGYNLEGKYILNFTGRRDGSSRFGPGKQFGNFGAIGAAWLFSNEKFIENGLPFLSFGKLRASIGATGNDKLTDYKYLSTYSAYSYSYQGASGLYPTQLTNPQFGWEKVNKIEAAIELGFIKDRFLFNLSWYRNRTGNQLVGYSLPDLTGFANVQANLPAVIENKGLEVDLTTTNIQTKDFSWTTSANISFPRNKLVAYPNIEGSSYNNVYAVGEPLFIKYRYVYTGISGATGLFTFQDIDNDGKITFAKDRKPVFVGQDFFGGLNNTLKYKDWSLDIFFAFTKQTGPAYLFNSLPGGYAGGLGNQPKYLLSEQSFQPFSQNYSSSAYTQNTLFNSSNGLIKDASYVRLKNVALSWRLPENVKGFLKIKGGRIYFQCQNLFTITSYKGLDPETMSFGLPTLRTITAGLQLTL